MARSTLLWLDPGKTTGWASYDTQTQVFVSGQELFVPLGEMLTNTAALLGPSLAIGWERFTVAGRRAGTPDYSLEVIGMAKWIARDCECLRPQNSSDRGMASHQVLRMIGWWSPGHRHANDAAQHLLTWITDYPAYMTSAMTEAFRASLRVV